MEITCTENTAQPLFDCTFPFDKKRHRRHLIYAHFHSRMSKFQYVYTVLVLLLQGVWAALYQETYLLLWLCLLFIWAVFFTVLAVNIRRSEALILDLSGGKPYSLSRTVTEGGIRFSNSLGSTEVLTFDQIRRVRVKGDRILVMNRQNVPYLMLRSGFTAGTAEEFLAFLKAKGVKIK